MQNTWRQGLALGSAPDARILHWRYQHVGIFWHYLALKFASPPKPNLKFVLSLTLTPDGSQWNIGGVGFQRKIWALAMYISLFLVSISFALGPVFQWNMGYKVKFIIISHMTVNIHSWYSLLFLVPR